MKLYATTTSERASKGQGGNNYIKIDLLVGDKKHPHQIGTINLIKEFNFYTLDFTNYKGKTMRLDKVKIIDKS